MKLGGPFLTGRGSGCGRGLGRRHRHRWRWRGDRRHHILRGEWGEGERGGGKKQSGGAAKLGVLLFHIEGATTEPS